MPELILINLSPNEISNKYLSCSYDEQTKISDINNFLSTKFGLLIRLYRVAPELRSFLIDYTIEEYLSLLSKVTDYQILGFKIIPPKAKEQTYSVLQELRRLVRSGEFGEFDKLYKLYHDTYFDEGLFVEAVEKGNELVIDFMLQLEDFIEYSPSSSLLSVCVNKNYGGGYKLAHKIVKIIENDPGELKSLVSREREDLYIRIFIRAFENNFWDIVVWSTQYFEISFRLNHETKYRHILDIKENRALFLKYGDSKDMYFYSEELRELQFVGYDRTLSNMSSIRLYLLLFSFRYHDSKLMEWLGEVDDNLKLSNLSNDLKADLIIAGLGNRSYDMISDVLDTNVNLQGVDIWGFEDTRHLEKDLVKRLLSSGATTNMNQGLNMYARINKMDEVCLFLDYGADIDAIIDIDENIRIRFLEHCNHPRVVSLQQKILQMIAQGQVTDPKELKKLPPGLDLDPHRQAQEEKEYKEYLNQK